MPPGESYPRWYLTLRGFVWGLAVGVFGTALYYDANFMQPGGSLRLHILMWLVGVGPAVLLAVIEIVIRVRHHLRLQRRDGLSA